jgi:ABC-2 type transport system permease protein
MGAIFKREMQAYFLTPMGYIYMGLFLSVSAVYFVLRNISTLSSQFTGFLASILFIYTFTIPILTMRLFSEEKRQKTDQLLLTSPVTLTGIVLGKFLAAFVCYAMSLVLTLGYALLIAFRGQLLVPETAGAYIGFLFLGGTYIALGLLVSAATENQVTAAIVSFFVLLVVQLWDTISNLAPTPLISLLSWLSLNYRYRDFAMGLLKFSSLFYYITFTALVLFFTRLVIDRRRYR